MGAFKEEVFGRTEKTVEPSIEIHMVCADLRKFLLVRDNAWAMRLEDAAHLIDWPKASVDMHRWPKTTAGGKSLRVTAAFGLSTGATRYRIQPIEPGAHKVGKALMGWIEAYQTAEDLLGDGLTAGPTTLPAIQTLQAFMRMVLHAAELHEGIREVYDNAQECDPFGLIQRTGEFLAAKDDDYGQGTRRDGVRGVMVRIHDKFGRIVNLLGRGQTPKFESVLDTAQDMVGYGLILVAYALEHRIPVHPDGTVRE